MDRRSFIRMLGFGALAPLLPGTAAKAGTVGDGERDVEVEQESSRKVVLQDSSVAGLAYYDCEAVWGRLRIGDELTLEREPDNSHDYRAIEVKWRGRKLGYVPRVENLTASYLMDQGTELSGLITRLKEFSGGRKGVEFNLLVAVSRSGATT